VGKSNFMNMSSKWFRKKDSKRPEAFLCNLS